MRPGSIKPFLFCGLLACSFTAVVQGQAPARDVAAPAKPPPGLPPLPSPPRSGIDFFRELLTASSGEREKLLAAKTPEHRKVLEASARSYLALTPEERELRLRTMELRFHLTSLLRTGTSNRTERLKWVPERDRLLIADRLKIWDQLSPQDQKEVLEDERKSRDFIGSGRSGLQSEVSLSGHTSNQVRQIERQLVRWQSLPENRRGRVQETFKRLFELTDEEKLRELPQENLEIAERDLMQKSLDRFKTLSPAQRTQCIRAFRQLAELSPAERRQFLVSAEEWQKMKPEDRESWRKLVNKVPPLPPLPPGYSWPPLPSRIQMPVSPGQVATN